MQRTFCSFYQRWVNRPNTNGGLLVLLFCSSCSSRNCQFSCLQFYKLAISSSELCELFFVWIYDWIPENIWRGNLWREAIILCSFLQCFIIEYKRFWNKIDFKKMIMLFFSLQRWQFCRLGILVFWWPSTCHWLIGGADKLGGIHLNIYFPSNKKADFLKYQIELKPKYWTISKFSWKKIWYLELLDLY